MAHEHIFDFEERLLPCIAVAEPIANFQSKLQVILLHIECLHELIHVFR